MTTNVLFHPPPPEITSCFVWSTFIVTTIENPQYLLMLESDTKNLFSLLKLCYICLFSLTQSHWCIQDAIEHQPLPVWCDAIKWNIDFLGIPVYVDIVGKKNSNVSENLQVIQLCTYRDFIFNHWHHKNIQCFKYKVTLWFCGAWIISIAKLHWHDY